MWDDVIDRLYLVRKIELGIAQADVGDVVEHKPFMAELEREDAKQDFLKPTFSSQESRDVNDATYFLYRGPSASSSQHRMCTNYVI